MSNLRGASIQLAQLFSQDFFFEIPVYQRPFRWNDDNLSDLVTDLIDAPRDQDYFLGTVVLHATAPTEYHIVDGQQRLTALCIMLACIRDTPSIASDPEWLQPIQDKIVQRGNILDRIPERQRLTPRDNRIFKEVVVGVGGTIAPSVAVAGAAMAEHRYVAACTIFHEKLSRLSASELRHFSQFVSQKVRFMYLATDDFDSAFRLFTIVNDRGMQLRRIDVLKSHNLTPDAIASETARNRCAASWESMEQLLGEDDFERVFHLLRLMYQKAKPQSDLLTEFQERILGQKGKPKRGEDFIGVLDKAVSTYNSIFLDRDFISHGPDRNRYFAMISIMVDNFSASEWKACVLAYALRFGDEKFFDFLMKVEKKYLELWVQGVRKDERYAAYVDILDQVEHSDSGSACVSAVDVDLKKIKEACDSSRFYGTGYCKYFLLRLEVLASECDVEKHFKARSVEHVLPQNPPSASRWWRHFSDADEIADAVHRVGNLVLLSKSKNSSASNLDFGEKKSKYLNGRVTDYPRSVQVLEESKWDRMTINRRTREIKRKIVSDPPPGPG